MFKPPVTSTPIEPYSEPPSAGKRMSAPLLPRDGSITNPSGNDTLTARSMRNAAPQAVDPAGPLPPPPYARGPATLMGADLSRGTEMPAGITSAKPLASPYGTSNASHFGNGRRR
jgi:hypothetical protein